MYFLNSFFYQINQYVVFLNNLYCFIHLVYFYFYFYLELYYDLIFHVVFISYYITFILQKLYYHLYYAQCHYKYFLQFLTVELFHKIFSKKFKIITVKHTLYVININASILPIDITKNYDKTRYLLTFKITLKFKYMMILYKIFNHNSC